LHNKRKQPAGTVLDLREDTYYYDPESSSAPTENPLHISNNKDGFATFNKAFY
jgi:hypothetical protein